MRENNKKTVFKFKINGNKYELNDPNATGLQLKSLGGIPTENELYLEAKGNSEDELILNEANVDLSNPGIEKFYSKESDKELVIITIDENPYNVEAGNYTGLQIKQIGNVNLSYELEQVINGLKTINDTDNVNIVGGEIFISHPKDGTAS